MKITSAALHLGGLILLGVIDLSDAKSSLSSSGTVSTRAYSNFTSTVSGTTTAFLNTTALIRNGTTAAVTTSQTAQSALSAVSANTSSSSRQQDSQSSSKTTLSTTASSNSSSSAKTSTALDSFTASTQPSNSRTTLISSVLNTISTARISQASIGSQTSVASASSSTPLGLPAAGTLLPAVHWDHPIDDPRNLEPASSADLYYSSHAISDPKLSHQFASLKTTWQQDVVFLLHSALIDTVTCQGGGTGKIIVTFADIVSLTHAADSWRAKQDFVIATYTTGCGSHEDQHSFFMAGEIVVDSASKTITTQIARQLFIEELLDEVELAWGTYTAPPDAQTPGYDDSSSGSDGDGSNSTDTINSYDDELDKLLGYFDFSQSDYREEVSEFAPDVTFDDDSLVYEDNSVFEFGDAASPSRRSVLAKRGFNPFKAVKAVFKKVGNTVAKVAKTVVKIVQDPKAILEIANDLLTFSPTLAKSFPIDLGPARKDQSPWGLQKLLFSKSGSTKNKKGQHDAALYCVRCGIQGNINLNGQASWSPRDKLSKLKAAVSASMTAGVNLGMVANAAYRDVQKKNLATFAVPNLGFAVRGVFSAGATVMLDAEMEYGFDAAGQALVGVELKWPKFLAELDAIKKDKGSKITGYEPEIHKVLEASGKIVADARLALPISVGIGIEVIPLKIKRRLQLIERPSVYGNIGFRGSTTKKGTKSTKKCPNGFSYFANVRNQVIFDVFGLNTYTLQDWTSKPILDGCKPISGKKARQNAGTGDPNTIVNDESPNFEPKNSGTAQYNGEVGDATKNPNNAEFIYSTNLALNSADRATQVEDIDFRWLISTSDSKLQFVVDPSGALVAAPAGVGSRNGTGLFGASDGVAGIDYQGRILHYYPDEMGAHGASRLRFSAIDETAKTSHEVVLKPVRSAEPGAPPNASILFAVDTRGNAYHLALCNYKDARHASRIFLADGDAGLAGLAQNPDVQNKLLGGPSAGCVIVALTLVQWNGA